MMATDQTQRQRFAELVKLQLQGRRFLERDQERRLLEEGLTRYGLTLEQATGVLRSAAEHDSIALEGELGTSSRELLRTLSDKRSRVSRDDFKRAVAFYRARTGVPEADAQKRVKRMMEELDLRPKPTGRVIRSRRWYRAINS
ncbi:hypothetical protein [Roseomonas alba]|nr:hypothetical protein [Neoroseomonas alba]